MAKHQVVKDIELNPFCAAFPEPSQEEYEKLRGSIKGRGQIIPIMLDKEGRILDGRTRFKVCQELMLRPKLAKWKGRGSDELYMDYVIDMNMHRRHLSTSQRQAIAAEMANISHGGHNKNRTEDTKNAESDEKQGANLHLAQKVTTAQAAKANKVSVRGVKAARKVKEQSPEVFEQVKAGTKTVHEALKEIEEPEPEEPSEIIDPFGNALPEKVAAVYADGGTLADLKSRIDKIRQEVEAMCERNDPLVAFLMGTALQGFQSEMKGAAAKIKFAIPYCLCPKCSGDKCLACKKTGWLPKEYYEQVIPKELQWKKK